MLAMTRINDIRKAYFDEGCTISAIAAKFGIDRKTARKYIEQDDFNKVPPVQSKRNRWPKLEPYMKRIDEWLEDDVKDRSKQRHTAKRVHARLEGTYPDFDCSYRTVASYVKEKKREIYSDVRAALPLEHKAGEAQVDFGSADFYENGTLCSGKYLTVSFPYSNAGYLHLFKGENRECLFEGLKAIFEHLGGVPTRLWFDNMSTVVKKVLKGGKRELCDAFLRFKEHHGFDAAFCNANAGHEKGNVENKVGYHRRNLLVPIPEFERLDRYNEELLRLCDEDHRREHYKRNSTIEALHREDKETRPPAPRRRVRLRELRDDEDRPVGEVPDIGSPHLLHSSQARRRKSAGKVYREQRGTAGRKPPSDNDAPQTVRLAEAGGDGLAALPDAALPQPRSHEVQRYMGDAAGRSSRIPRRKGEERTKRCIADARPVERA